MLHENEPLAVILWIIGLFCYGRGALLLMEGWASSLPFFRAMRIGEGLLTGTAGTFFIHLGRTLLWGVGDL